MAKAAKTPSKQQSSKTLEDLLVHGLKDMYYAEKKIYRSLPKMIKAASNDQLRTALEQHREETAGQVERLERAFEAMGKRPKAERCDAIDGILEEGDTLLEDFGGSAAGDAAIIFSAQAVEHYEIARYGSLCAYAELLGLDEVKTLLGETLDQEEAADTKLSDVAEGGVNEEAANAMEAQDEAQGA